MVPPDVLRLILLECSLNEIRSFLMYMPRLVGDRWWKQYMMRRVPTRYHCIFEGAVVTKMYMKKRGVVIVRKLVRHGDGFLKYYLRLKDFPMTPSNRIWMFEKSAFDNRPARASYKIEFDFSPYTFDVITSSDSRGHITERIQYLPYGKYSEILFTVLLDGGKTYFRNSLSPDFLVYSVIDGIGQPVMVH